MYVEFRYAWNQIHAFWEFFWHNIVHAKDNTFTVDILYVVLANGCSEYQATSTCKPNLSRYFIMKFLTLLTNLEYSTCIFHRW